MVEHVMGHLLGGVGRHVELQLPQHWQCTTTDFESFIHTDKFDNDEFDMTRIMSHI